MADKSCKKSGGTLESDFAALDRGARRLYFGSAVATILSRADARVGRRAPGLAIELAARIGLAARLLLDSLEGRGRIGQLWWSDCNYRIDGLRRFSDDIPVFALGLARVLLLQSIASCHDVVALHEIELSPRYAAGHVLGHESNRCGPAAVTRLATGTAARTTHGSSISSLASIAVAAAAAGAPVAGFAIGADAVAAAGTPVAGLAEIADAKAASGAAAARHTVVADAGTAAGLAIGRATGAAHARFAPRVECSRAASAEHQREREGPSGPHRFHTVFSLVGGHEFTCSRFY